MTSSWMEAVARQRLSLPVIMSHLRVLFVILCLAACFDCHMLLLLIQY
jgi:hypothetical protein